MKITNLLMGVLILSFTTGHVWAQNADVGMVAGTSDAEVSVNEFGKVSLNFRETEIQNVFKILSLKSGVNIVSGPEVTGTVSIQLKDVPWLMALEVILETYGYSYERKGEIILVTTVENLKKRREDSMLLAEQEPVVTSAITINFGKASEIISSIEKMKSDRGSIDFDERTNTLIITDIQSKVDLMVGIIKKLDRVTHQVMIDCKIVETQFTDTENLGVDWVLRAAVGGSARPTTYPFRGTSSNSFLGGVFPHIVDASDSLLQDKFSYGTLSLSELTSVLEILKTRSDTNIRLAPKIVTLDNHPAEIVVGRQYPIPSYTYNEEQARLQVNDFEYKDIGIIFSVTPHVNDKGFITLDLNPRITEILSFVTVENTSLPLLSNESVQTKVIVKDGDSVVIGGLVKEKETDIKKRVPGLGSIPILGHLFKKSNVVETKTDLLIFITPHIITPTNE